jgi:hypothetical protein
MRVRLALCVSALAALATPVAAQAAVGNPYNDGNDAAVDRAAPDNFRLNLYTLEPGCFPAPHFATSVHFDIGDDNRSAHVSVSNGAPLSVDQVLVPGRHTGYAVINTFDTGTVDNDPDIDPDQTGTNLEAPLVAGKHDEIEIDDVSRFAKIIVCVSDHEDSGQNEPYAHSDSPAGANEVYAKNRPVIQPTVASLGQGALNGIAKTYKMGLGYEIESWYDEYNFADVPPFQLDWTDPMAFGDNPDGTNTPSHVSIPPRIAGPVFDAMSDGPGVLRVNDIDVAGEEFDDPHYEASDYGQTTVFHAAGDPFSACLGGLTCSSGPASLISFGTQGDLPVSWSLKPSLASVDSLRSVDFTQDDFEAWQNGWEAYYCGTGARPDLPLTPGTNSPDPRNTCPIIVNPPVSQPPTSTGTNTTTVVTKTNTVVVDNSCSGNKNHRVTFKKKAKKGKLSYLGKTVKAKKSHGRLRATARLKGVKGAAGSYVAVVKKTKVKRWSQQTLLFKLCG